MRTERTIAALAGMLIAAAPVFAQYPATQTILQPEVEVRCGPSKNFFTTSKLNKGDKVIVLRANKDPNWLEIQPPSGSFSWINARYVRQIDATHGVVQCDPASPAPSLAGSKIVEAQPNTECIKLLPGTQIVLVQPAKVVQGETWLPIAPHPNEVRYIPADAVSPAKVVVAQQVGATKWTLEGTQFTTNPTIAEADKAYASGDYDRARLLYQQVANGTDANQKVYAMNKLAAMAQPGGTPAIPASNSKTTAMSPSNATAGLLTLKPAAWTQYGRLSETQATADAGQPLYKLEMLKGDYVYVAADPSKSLKIYVNRTIAVYGPTLYRPDGARLPYVMATHTSLP